MRIGFIGPADGDVAALREALDFLLGDAGADSVVYMGEDDTADLLAEESLKAATGGTDGTFLGAAVDAALHGSPAAIAALLDADAEFEKLRALQILPPAPARAVEMLDDRMVLLVHDKAVLAEDDIANASVIVFGRSKELLLKRFGSRYFFTPGPLSQGQVGLLEREGDGRLAAAAFDLSGRPLWREILQWRTAKIMVAT
ncbi:MAG: hypothetical protein R3B40_11170 [Polyangiales bacterium]|nr:hypothetical protein [Myxococcales bacterium]MCB9657986.1 hypothetical protein [Sandaracinaceae bacterium]